MTSSIRPEEADYGRREHTEAARVADRSGTLTKFPTSELEIIEGVDEAASFARNFVEFDLAASQSTSRYSYPGIVAPHCVSASACTRPAFASAFTRLRLRARLLVPVSVCLSVCRSVCLSLSLSLSVRLRV